MDMHTDLTAVPHASLRNPNPERSRKTLPKEPGGLQKEVRPKTQVEIGRQDDDGRSPLQSA